ncbi:MAG: dTDP-4-dehydrorhamnose reductase [Spirochaetales bacterium]|nr:dTDP-4-dehydrorhamnose reductase [Spirochaetales bacterium]
MIWLVGSKGMLGTDLEKLFIHNSLEYIATDKEVDITDPAALNGFIKKQFADHTLRWIINCAAYTAVDQAEEDREPCFAINSLGPKNLAIMAEKTGATLVHISTDYVFNGQKKEAYVEDDPTAPLGVYGQSKLEGEKAIQENCRQFYILRTAWLYGKNNKNFVTTMLKLFAEKDELKIISDQWGSPTYTKDLAAAILAIIKSKDTEGTEGFGIYHFTNTGRTNWFEFAREIQKQALEMGLLKKPINLVAIPTEAYPTKAKRPKNSYLSKDKLIKEFNITIPDWQNGLNRFLEELTND